MRRHSGGSSGSTTTLRVANDLILPGAAPVVANGNAMKTYISVYNGKKKPRSQDGRNSFPDGDDDCQSAAGISTATVGAIVRSTSKQTPCIRLVGRKVVTMPCVITVVIDVKAAD
jgi:hypothetical protein